LNRRKHAEGWKAFWPRLRYCADVAPELCFFFFQPVDGFSETEVSFPGFKDQESAEENKEQAGTEIEDSRQELHHHEADGAECEARLHVTLSDSSHTAIRRCILIWQLYV